MTQVYIERYWRDAKPEDAIKEPPMVARFRDINYPWKINTLRGVRQGSQFPWFSESKGSFQQCQVYDAPDPGEGWRLVDVEKETPKEGDQYFAQSSKVWCFYNDVTRIATYSKGSIIRRRITPTVTYVPFTWEDRDQLRGRWITWKHENGLMIESQINHINQHRDGGLWFKSHDAKWLLENATFIDTGKPVGKEVVQ